MPHIDWVSSGIHAHKSICASTVHARQITLMHLFVRLYFLAGLLVTLARAEGEPTEIDSLDHSRKSLAEIPSLGVGIELGTYEGNRVGYTFDQGDDGYLDFTLSPLVFIGRNRYGAKPVDIRGWPIGSKGQYWWEGILAMNMRAGQYIATRNSSPVVGKRFNPLGGVRISQTPGSRAGAFRLGYADLVYAHESNGASISNLESFQRQFAADQTIERDPAKAYRRTRDDISRGWDYFGIDCHFVAGAPHRNPAKQLTFKHSFGSNLHIYTRKGFAQGVAEEYSSWEPGEAGKPRQYYDGLGFYYQTSLTRRYSYDLLLKWTTGYSSPVKYNTWSAEIGYIPASGLKLIVRVRYGYNSDLVDYFRKDKTIAFALSFGG